MARPVHLSTWPAATRAICRREEPHPGATSTLFEPDGWRHQVFITNSADDDIICLEVRHRRHAHVEDRIKGAKALGLDPSPATTTKPTAPRRRPCSWAAALEKGRLPTPEDLHFAT